MLITRSPLRISLGGGGTDLPSYYRDHTGYLISAAIDKYVYVTALRPFLPGIFLKYSQLEHVETAQDIQHPIIREAVRMLNFRTPQIEITALADIPSYLKSQRCSGVYLGLSRSDGAGAAGIHDGSERHERLSLRSGTILGRPHR